MTEYPDCCLECELETKEFYHDPRTPPIDEHDCLCRACHLNVLRKLAGEAATDLENFEEQISALEHKYRDMPLAEMISLLQGENPKGVAKGSDFFKEVGHRLKLATSVVAVSGEDKGGALKDAVEFLKEVLKDGPMLKKAIDILATEGGHTMTTLKRAAKEIGVVKSQVHDGKKIVGWEWNLPLNAVPGVHGRG